jgi:hypothetical protein
MNVGTSKYCPTCDERTEVYEDEPWVGALCKNCLALIE